MALTQQLARVDPRYVERCREVAAAAPDGDPRWDVPVDDTLDPGWAIWDLLGLYRSVRPHDPCIGVLERSIEGDRGGEVAFLDHPEFYDGFGGAPALVAPAVVAGVARELAAMDIGPVLEELPAYRTAGGLLGFTCDPHVYLRERFAVLQGFYVKAGRSGMAVVTWVD